MAQTKLGVGLVACGLLALACGEDDGNGKGHDHGSGGSTTITTAGGGNGQGGGTTQGGGTAQGGTSSQGGSAAGGSGGQGAAPMACDQPNPDGGELVELVNAYRESNALPAIPYSPSLSCVAVTHVHDLYDNQPHTEPNCNLHSWSDQGPWTPCCYTPDHAQAQCMWIKPQELTTYPGYGYENAASGAGSPEQALDMWKGSPAHNEVILNAGIWASHPWHAVGAGLYQGYATLWFGEQTDPAR